MYRNPCFARQLRRLTAAAYPEDGARGPTGSFVGAKTAEDRAYSDLGSLAAWPGHGKMLNVADEEDKPARTLKYESWSGDFPNGMTLPATSSSVAADVLEAKLNPPVNFHDRLAVGEYYTGLPNAFVGGVVDPLHRKCLHENHGISNDHAVYINPSAQNLAEAKHPSDTSTSPNYLEQNLSSTGPAAAIFQAPFTSERQTQGFAELPKIKGSVLSDARHPGRLEKEIKYHFSTCGALYDVHGTTGSTNDDEVNVGVVTDHAALALFWRNLLHPMRPKGFYENTDYSPMVQIYHAGGYTLERERVIEEFGGPKPQDLGIEHENFVLVDPYSKPATALVSGVLDVGACRDLAAYLNSLVLFDELDTLTLPGHATYDIKSNTVDVFINGPADLTASPFLYGAHHLTLSPDGLGRVWNGVTRNGAAADNYNLITKQDETVNTTTVLPRKINDPASAAKMRSFYTDASKVMPQSAQYISHPKQASMTLGKPSAASSESCLRPNLVALAKTNLIFSRPQSVGKKELSASEAGQMLIEDLTAWGYLYGEQEPILKAVEDAMQNGVKCYSQGPASRPDPTPTPTPTPAAKPTPTPAAGPQSTPAPKAKKAKAKKSKN